MNDITDAALARLAPPILTYFDEVGVPHELLTTPGGVSTLLIHDPGTDSYFIDVVVLLDDGPRLVMRLDPAQRGLIVRDGTLDADDFAA